jgi:glucosamine-6-phosphate deaminase
MANDVKLTQYDKMTVAIFDSDDGLASSAAHDLALILSEAVSNNGSASIILATGNSQLPFIKALRVIPSIPWKRITVFHMDEYIGVSDAHPASFRRYMREELADVVHPLMLCGIIGDAPDVAAEMARYSELLREHDPVACVLGIGENGHLAFNDPPADFSASELVHVVSLADASRRQQVGEGHFSRVDDVPHKAISLTIPALLRPAHVLAVVPEKRKANAVRAALEGEVSPECPASILRTRSNARLYLDSDSASLLGRRG